jgi:predicted phage terminase large subunit-like protein
MAPHLRVLSLAVAKALAGLGPNRLIVQMPPRHGKSELISYWTPLWFLDRWPARRVMLAAYEAEFAATWGRRVRDSVPDLRAESKIRFQVAPEASARSMWLTDQGGMMITAGVGGPVTGKGGDLVIVDDPVKNAQEALSPLVRERTWDWWRSTMRTRIEPGGVAIVVMTRWHPEDLAGKLIIDSNAGGEHWHVISFPAISEGFDELGRAPGDALWPARYNVEALKLLERSLGPLWWAALFQQRPFLPEGSVIKTERFVKLPATPTDFVRRVRFWDLAATPEGAAIDPDYTAGALIGVRPSGRWTLADMIHGRWSPADVKALIKRTAEADGKAVPIRVEQEPGSAGKAQIADIVSMLSGWDVAGIRATGPQLVRVMPFVSQIEVGNVEIVDASWVQRFLEECRMYRGDGGSHDDQVVAAAGAFSELAVPQAAVATTPPQADPELELEVV